MPLTIPPELKKIAPYIKRAEELDKDTTSPESRLVAYYCRQYAVHLGIPLAGAAPNAKTCLAELLGDLEKEKPAMDNFTRAEAAFLCRKFAEGVFEKADGEDRAGQASKVTAKTFYAAASFLQMLEQFADADADAEQVAEDKKRIVYSKWKSTEILKAIKEGRQPTPGAYGEEEPEEHPEDEQEQDSPARATSLGGGTMGGDEGDVAAPTNGGGVENVAEDEGGFGLPPQAPTTSFGLPPAPASQPFQPYMPPPPPPEDQDTEMQQGGTQDEDEGTEVALGPPPAYPADDDAAPGATSQMDRPAITFDLPAVDPIPLPAPTSPPKAKSGGIFGGFKKKAPPKQATKAMISDATELTRFALAALEEKDASLAAERLQQALEALGR